MRVCVARVSSRREMLSLLVAVAVSAALWTTGDGSLTRGFPSLEELRANGFLVDRYSTHDGELRSVPGFWTTSNCSGSSGRISRIAFIALPGSGDGMRRPPVLRFVGNGPPKEIELNGMFERFGPFGYEKSFSPPMNMMFSNGDMLEIRHPPYEQSDLRLLHQVGTDARNICWSIEPNGSENCQSDYDYPLLAIETDPPGCIEGVLVVDVLKRLWENRTLPVLYSSPERDISVDCSENNPVITRILVGAYNSTSGEEPPQIKIGDQTCNVSTEPVTGGVNVYECQLNSPVEDDSLTVCQRNATSQIGFLHDGQTDTPLINISGGCSSSQLLSEAELMENASLYITIERENDKILFQYLNFTQDGLLVNWTFVARNIGKGEKYPQLSIVSNKLFNRIENINCSDTHFPNVYECSFDPRRVQAGDFIVVFLPPRSSARLLLSFILNEGPLGDSITTGEDVEGLPLMTVGVVPLQSSTVSPSTLPTPSPSITFISPSVITSAPTLDQPQPPLTTGSPSQTPTSPSSSPTDVTSDPDNSDPEASSSTGVIVGAVVGLILAVLLFLAVAVLLVFILCRRKSAKYGVEEEKEEWEIASESGGAPMDNPVYSGRDSEPGRPTGDTHHQYDVPSSQPPPPTASGAQVYEVPDKTPSNGETNKSFENPGYYSTIQEVHTTTDHSQMLSSNHYEMAIYVPTQEQRKYVESGAVPTENIYATLEESQAGDTGRTLSFFEECETYWRPASNKEELYQQLSQRKYREIPKHQIKITEHLGSGQFGTVNKGLWQSGEQGGLEVAVKMLQEGTSEQDTVRFLQEAAINGQFRHPNIVQLLGVATVGKPAMIVLELVSHGDLRGYLLKHKPTPGELPPPETGEMLVQFCVQVARGMEYLSGKAFVHRDLAARNILITETKTCKISDFGMARDLEEGTYYVSHGGKVPVKWTAPEALHYKKYSTASDVWSFGCLMYEIWSLGHKPFEGYTNPDTLKLIDNGCRLAPPPGCPEEMYRLMITCWNADKAGRPQFREVVETLSQPDHLLLLIPEEVTRGHPQASVLGAPLEAGRNLYTQLQNTYMQ